MFWIFALVVLASCTPQSRASDGGIKIQLTQKGLEYGKEFGLQMLMSKLKNEKIQDIDGSYQVPLVGNVHYSVSEIQIKELQVSHSTAGFVEGTGLKLSIQNADFMLSGTWKYSASFRSENGIIDISIKQLSLSALLGLDKDDQGRPVVRQEGCQSSIGGLDLKLSGKSSWLYNMLASVLKGVLRSEVNKQLCTEVKKGIDGLEQVLRTMNVSSQIDRFAGIDYSLVNPPAVGADRCDVDLKGEFFMVGKPSESPLHPVPFHLLSRSDSMLQLGVSDFFVNSAASVYFNAGAMQVNYTDEMIPKNTFLRLNTNDMGPFIPELKERFPNRQMEVSLGVRKQPLLQIRPDGLHASLLGAAEIFVVQPNAKRVPAFLFHFETKLTGEFHLEPVTSGNYFGKVKGSLDLKKFHLWLEKSNIGDVKAPHLENLLKLAGPLALLRANQVLKKGVVIPDIIGASVRDPKITMHEGYVLLASDLHHRLHNTM